MPPTTILVIEDNLDNLGLIRFLLEQAGHTVLDASDGKQGLQLAQEHLPAAVVLDLTLPGMDGWELARQLKAGVSTARIPIIALTAHTLPGDRKRALEAGCDGYLTKPLDAAQFAKQVAAFLTPPDPGETH